MTEQVEPAESTVEENFEPKRSRRRTKVLADRPADQDQESGTDERLSPRKVRKRIVARPAPSSQSGEPSSESASSLIDSPRAISTGDSADPVHATPRRIDVKAREELSEIQTGRRKFLKTSAIGAGIFALGASLGFGSGLASATGFGGQTVITNNEIAARVIAGVRIATEFIPTPVPAGTDVDPFPGSAIQAALNDGLSVYIPAGTWKLTGSIARAIDNVTIIGAGKGTKLTLDGVTPCISAATQTGWLIADLATDGGGVDISPATQCRITEIWENGVLTDNRPIASGGGGSGGYYAIRAADYITQGDGSPANPYNASAIQSAINALPKIGGTVFIKSGVWAGTSRIVISGPNIVGGKHKVILRGEGALYGYSSNSGSPLYYFAQGTHVAAGFDVYTPTDFYDMSISSYYTNYSVQPAIKISVDPTQVGDPPHLWLGGFSIKRCRIAWGNPGLWITGSNMNLSSDSWQIYHALLEQVFFDGGIQAIQIDKGGDSRTGQIELSMHQIHAWGVQGGKRTFNCTDVENIWGVWSDLVFEGCSQSGVDYCLATNSGGGHMGHVIQNVFFGDGSFANQDAYINSARSSKVMNFFYTKGMTIKGCGHFQVSQYPNSSNQPLGTVNISAIGIGELKVEPIPGETYAIGTLSGALSQILLIPPMDQKKGYIGTATPGASPYTYTNNDCYKENVYIVGGSVIGVTRNGQSLGAATSHILLPGESIVISYTTAPSILRYAVS